MEVEVVMGQRSESFVCHRYFTVCGAADFSSSPTPHQTTFSMVAPPFFRAFTRTSRVHYDEKTSPARPALPQSDDGRSARAGEYYRVSRARRRLSVREKTRRPGRSGEVRLDGVEFRTGARVGAVRDWRPAKPKGCPVHVAAASRKHEARGGGPSVVRSDTAVGGRRAAGEGMCAWREGRNPRFSDLMTCVRSEMCNDTRRLVNIGTSDDGLLCGSDVCGRGRRHVANAIEGRRRSVVASRAINYYAARTPRPSSQSCRRSYSPGGTIKKKKK